MTEAAEAALEETTTEEVVVLAEADLVAEAVLGATEVRLQEEKAALEATEAVHQTDQLAEAKVFHLTDQEEREDFLKELHVVLKDQDLKLQEQEDREETKSFS